MKTVMTLSRASFFDTSFEVCRVNSLFKLCIFTFDSVTSTSAFVVILKGILTTNINQSENTPRATNELKRNESATCSIFLLHFYDNSTIGSGGMQALYQCYKQTPVKGKNKLIFDVCTYIENGHIASTVSETGNMLNILRKMSPFLLG